ncbi:hypothetical protein PSSHI_27160 [Photobacterium sp. R1]
MRSLILNISLVLNYYSIIGQGGNQSEFFLSVFDLQKHSLSGNSDEAMARQF